MEYLNKYIIFSLRYQYQYIDNNDSTYKSKVDIHATPLLLCLPSRSEAWNNNIFVILVVKSRADLRYLLDSI